MVNLHQADKIHNLHQACDVSGCIPDDHPASDSDFFKLSKKNSLNFLKVELSFRCLIDSAIRLWNNRPWIITLLVKF